MNDEQLLEWYKNNKNSKPTDMSDKDYELTMNKAIKVQQDKLLQDNYKNQQSAIVQQQKNAEQSASISNEKLLKYLGQKQQASGLASGQTSSDFIKANNNYIANRANIANNTAAQQTELLNTYNSSKLQNESETFDNEMSILDKYYNRNIQEEERLRNNAIQDKQLTQADEDRLREIEQWELEMEAYRQQLEDNKNDKLKEEKEQYDSDWFALADAKMQQLIISLQDEDGKLSNSDKNLISSEMSSYKNKLSNEYYQRLLDTYKTSIIGM